MVNMGEWRAAWIGAAICLAAGCVGGGGRSQPDAGGDGGGCFECRAGCFDCGGGCQCADSSVPDASLWVSPFPETGEDGTWRDGTSRLCVGGQANLEAIDVWSDTRGVYALIAGSVLGLEEQGSGAEAPEPAGAGGGSAGAGGIGGFGGAAGFGGGPTGCFDSRCLGEAILFNDGNAGWTRIYEQAEMATFNLRRLSGAPSGPLMLWGTVPRFAGTEACAFGHVDPAAGELSCQRPTGAPTAVFPVNGSLAYAAIGADLARFDGSSWSVFGPPSARPIASLWADATDVAMIDLAGQAFVLRDDAWLSIGAVGVAMWGTAIDDLWIATALGALSHYDGNTTTDVAALNTNTPCGQTPQVTGVWGSGDTLYFYGPRTLQRWDGTRFEALGDWTCDFVVTSSITRVWGNGPNEVFVALSDFNRPFTDPACGNGIVMYFDGTQFHSL